MIVKINEKGITKKDLSAEWLGCETVEDYYDCIRVTNVEGQTKQAIEMFKAMNAAQRKDCLQYFRVKAWEGETSGERIASNNILSICIENIY